MFCPRRHELLCFVAALLWPGRLRRACCSLCSPGARLLGGDDTFGSQVMLKGFFSSVLQRNAVPWLIAAVQGLFCPLERASGSADAFTSGEIAGLHPQVHVLHF